AWFRVGETIRYDLTGKLRPGVSAKDIFLFIAGKWGAHVNQNIEYGGSGMASMGVKARNPKPFTPTMPDDDAVYRERRAIDLGTIEPLVALPDAVVNNSVGIREVAGRKIDQAFIGACCNGTLDDLAVAARVVKGRKVASGTRFIVTPSTEAIHRAAIDAGYVRTLMDAGAIVTTATCGACI